MSTLTRAAPAGGGAGACIHGHARANAETAATAPAAANHLRREASATRPMITARKKDGVRNWARRSNVQWTSVSKTPAQTAKTMTIGRRRAKKVMFLIRSSHGG